MYVKYRVNYKMYIKKYVIQKVKNFENEFHKKNINCTKYQYFSIY